MWVIYLLFIYCKLHYIIYHTIYIIIFFDASQLVNKNSQSVAVPSPPPFPAFLLTGEGTARIKNRSCEPPLNKLFLLQVSH